LPRMRTALAVFLDLLRCGLNTVVTKSRILRPLLQRVSGCVSNLTRNGVLFIIKQAGRGYIMTTYWTALVLTIFVDGHQMQSRLLFPSMKACGDASAVIYHDYVKTYFRNSIAQCEKSELISSKLTKLPRPKPRPVWLEK
jgi:hypothetical protein